MGTGAFSVDTCQWFIDEHIFENHSKHVNKHHLRANVLPIEETDLRTIHQMAHDSRRLSMCQQFPMEGHINIAFPTRKIPHEAHHDELRFDT